MPGTINGIWLTGYGGKLHRAIQPNMSTWVQDASECDFEIVLWTNTNEIDSSEIAKLTRSGIVVKDHSECEKSSLYRYFIFFFEKGITGDKTAFALASDILRMAILELTPENQYFIYVDPNDVCLRELKASLSTLEKFTAENTLGLSFYVSPLAFNKSIYHTRNDVLIALKKINPDFFSAYFKAYESNLAIKHVSYFKPETDGEAQTLACDITNQTGNNFFIVQLIKDFPPMIKATFGDFFEFCRPVDCTNYLPHDRQIEYANTWLPKGDYAEELEDLLKHVDFQYLDSSYDSVLSEPFYFSFPPLMAFDFNIDIIFTMIAFMLLQRENTFKALLPPPERKMLLSAEQKKQEEAKEEARKQPLKGLLSSSKLPVTECFNF